MSVSDFNAVVAEDRKSWSPAAEAVYDAASRMFTAELDDRAELGARLAAARQQRQMTQAEVSAVADIQQAEISRIERGLSNPTLDTLTRLSAAVGLKVTLDAR